MAKLRAPAWSLLFLTMLLAQFAIASEQSPGRVPASPRTPSPAARRAGTPPPSPSSSHPYDVDPDITWWCGDSPLDTPPVYNPESKYPINYLFTPSAVSTAVAALVGTTRGNFKKYPGKFMNTDSMGGRVMPEVGMREDMDLKYFPIMSDGLKWAPETKRADQDGGNFRIVYWLSGDKLTVKFLGLVYHPEKSALLRRCRKFTSKELRQERAKRQGGNENDGTNAGRGRARVVPKSA